MIAIPIASLHPIAGVGSILGTLNALSVNPIGGAVHGERLTRLQIVNPRATRIVVLRIHVSVAIVQVHDAAAVNRALAVVCGSGRISPSFKRIPPPVSDIRGRRAEESA